MVCPLGSSKEHNHLVGFLPLGSISTIMWPLLSLFFFHHLELISASVSIDHHSPHVSKSQPSCMFVPFPRYLYQGINSCISEECSHINKLSFIERMFGPFPSTVPSESNSLLGSAGYKLTRSCSSLPGQAPRVLSWVTLWLSPRHWLNGQKKRRRKRHMLSYREGLCISSGKWEASVLARRYATCAASEGLNSRAKIFGCRNPDAPSSYPILSQPRL